MIYKIICAETPAQLAVKVNEVLDRDRAELVGGAFELHNRYIPRDDLRDGRWAYQTCQAVLLREGEVRWAWSQHHRTVGTDTIPTAEQAPAEAELVGAEET